MAQGFVEKRVAFIRTKERIATVLMRNLDDEIDAMLALLDVQMSKEALYVKPNAYYMTDLLANGVMLQYGSNILIYEHQDARTLAARSGQPGCDEETLEIYLTVSWWGPWTDNDEGITRFGKKQTGSEYAIWRAEILRGAILEVMHKYVAGDHGIEVLEMETASVQNTPLTGDPDKKIVEAATSWRIEIDARRPAQTYSQ